MKLSISTSVERPWTVYLLHHSHTDIGYTETQQRIQQRHRRFTDQALDLIKNDADFVWNNECHWALEGWWKDASAERRQELVGAVNSGNFGLSGTYAHFNEMIDDFVVRRMLNRSVSFAREIGADLDSAISSDINGFGWGYSQALYDHGVRNLIVQLHSHHGLTPLDRRQTPFWWETPKGDRLLVWLGEHYNIGNVLGLCPGGHLTHGLKDEWNPKQNSEDHGLIAATRLPRYLCQLERSGYQQDFVMLGISGTMTDNAPPNERILNFAREWNAEHGEQIRIKMVTSSQYAKMVRDRFEKIPVYKGDWPDWWSDGFASQPTETRLIRQSQREYARSRSLAAHHNLTLLDESCDVIEQAIALYTEHTYGHSDSMMTPWEEAVKVVSGIKRTYAYTAVEAAEAISDSLHEALGATPLAANRPFIYRVINSTNHPVSDCVLLHLEGPDHGTRDLDCIIVELGTDIVYPAQRMKYPRGIAWGIWVELEPFEIKDFEMKEGLVTISTTERNCTDFIYYEVDSIPDVIGREDTPTLSVGKTGLKTPFVTMTWEKGGEISSWVDAISGHNLLSTDRQHGPFTPVYERTIVLNKDSAEAQMRARGRMGRNRKGVDVVRSSGQISSVEVISDGPLAVIVQFEIALAGCSLAQMVITAWNNAPRVDISFRCNKDSVWDPENLFMSLPFSTGSTDQELWLEKSGVLMRPYNDQLPGSLTDFYTIHDGFAVCGPQIGLAVSSPDVPLLQLGPLEFGRRILGGAPDLLARPFRPYGWLMTNYWETNFDATLGGFHEFRYRVEWGEHVKGAKQAIDLCHTLNQGVKAFRAN